MTRTLYLHVGDGRCGSSSIQRLGANQRAALLERGVDYPTATSMGFETKWEHGGNGRVIAQLDEDPVPRVAGYLAASNAERFLISAEHLRTTSESRLTQLADTLTQHDIRVLVVLYLREQCEWLVSNWAQGLKSHGWDTTLDGYLSGHAARGFTAPTLAYAGRCRRLRDIFGAENVVVRRFQRDALVDSDVRSDIMRLVGVDANDLIAAEPRVNESVSVEEAVMLRVLNGLPDRGLYDRRQFRRQVYRVFVEENRPRRRDLYRLANPATMRVTRSHYAEPNLQFREEFMPDQPVFSSVIPDDYEQVSEDECVTVRGLQVATDFLAMVAQRKLRTRTRTVG